MLKPTKNQTWNIILLFIRVWLGYRMFTASFSSVVGMLGSAEERQFFINWFGKELHYPMPLVMAFMAKSAELSGGIFLFAGLFSKAASSLIALTMFIATVTANLGKDFTIDGGFTISYFLFALIFIVWGGGRYSVDYLILKKRNSIPSDFVM